MFDGFPYPAPQVGRLQPCLSEAEARVVVAVVREAEEAREELGLALARWGWSAGFTPRIQNSFIFSPS